MKNDPHFESKLIEKVCPKSISRNVLNEIRKDETSRHEINCLKKTPNEKKKKNYSRIKYREKCKENPGDYKSKT